MRKATISQLPSAGFKLVASLFLGSGLLAPLKAQGVSEFELPPPERVLVSDSAVLVTAVRELSDGRTLVADRSPGLRLLMVDWSQLTVKELGPPLQYRRPLRLLALGGDSTLMTDATTRDWQILDGTVLVRTLPATEPLPTMFGGDLLGVDLQGHVLAVRAPPERKPDRGPAPLDTLVAELVDLGTSNVDRVAWLRGPAQFARSLTTFVQDGKLGIVALPLITEEQALLFRDGWIAVARQDPYRVDWRSPEGKWLQGEPLPFTPILVDEAEECFQLEGCNWGCEFADDLEWPSVLPPFVSYRGVAEIANYRVGRLTNVLWATPEGLLLIRRTPSRSRPGTRYDVVDRGGVLIARIAMDGNDAIVGFGEESVYTITTNADGSQTLRRHGWPGIPPRGAEARTSPGARR